MTKFHELTVKEVRRETAECCSILFDVPVNLQDQYKFQAGQYLTLKTVINGEDIRRSYSVCVAPSDGELRVAVKKLKGGRFSTYANDVLKAGDRMDVMTPMGNFTKEMNAENENNYIFFAGGSGITPVLSLVKTVLIEEPKSKVRLFFGNETVASIIFREEIEAMKNKYMENFQVYYLLNREMLDAPLFNGMMNKEKCQDLVHELPFILEAEGYYICGPEPMILAVKDVLAESGVASDKVHFELFGTSAPKGPKKAVELKEEDKGRTTEIVVNLDGKAFSFDIPYQSENILDAALKKGADLPFACKGGVCCTCKAKLVEGEVDMRINYALEKEEVDAGFILTCQAYPTSDKVVVDFDTW